MTSWQSLVGDDIELRIEAELFRQDGEDEQPAQPDAPSIDPSVPAQD